MTLECVKLSGGEKNKKRYRKNMVLPVQCSCRKNKERMCTMLNKIVSKENIKFKELEKEIFRYMNMIGCSIMKSILEEEDERIFNEIDKEKYTSKGFEGTSIQTIMGNIPYKRRRYIVEEECVKKTVYLLDEKLGIFAIKKISGNVVEKIIDIVKTNTYRETAKILEETTGTVLSFEGIRDIVLEVGKRIEDREKRLVELKKKDQLVQGEKEVVALFEEADGIFINLQGKDRKEALEEQEKNKGCENNEHIKVKKELKLHVMYEGWKKGDKRHPLVNKTYTAGIMEAKELKKIRDAKVYEKYNEDAIKLRVLNGDGASWTKALTPKGGIYQKDYFHIIKKINDCISEEYRNRIIQLITTKASYRKIYNELEKIKYEEDGIYEKVKKIEQVQNYLKNGLKRYSDIVEVPKAPKGIEFRRLGTQESQIFSTLKVRLKSGRKSFSIKGANALAKICVLADKLSIEEMERPIAIDTSVEDYIKKIEDNIIKNKNSCRLERVGKGDWGVKQSHSAYKFMKDIFRIREFSNIRF